MRNLVRFGLVWAIIIWGFTLNLMAYAVWLRYTVFGGQTLAQAQAVCDALEAVGKMCGGH